MARRDDLDRFIARRQAQNPNFGHLMEAARALRQTERL